MNVIRQAVKDQEESNPIQSIRYVSSYSFYIAARYGRRAEAKRIAERLIELGHKVTSTWIDQVEDEMLYDEGPEAAAKFAQKDLYEIETGDALLYLSEVEDNPWGRGGRHVEFGYALALKKTMMVIGPMENLFHYLPNVSHFLTESTFFYYMRSN